MRGASRSGALDCVRDPFSFLNHLKPQLLEPIVSRRYLLHKPEG